MGLHVTWIFKSHLPILLGCMISQIKDDERSIVTILNAIFNLTDHILFETRNQIIKQDAISCKL